MTMIQAARERWQEAGTQIYLVMVLWWLNFQLDLIMWRLRLNAMWWAYWQRQPNRKRECV
jgi:hypothetical protein